MDVKQSSKLVLQVEIPNKWTQGHPWFAITTGVRLRLHTNDQLCQSNAWEESRNIPTTLLPSCKAFDSLSVNVIIAIWVRSRNCGSLVTWFCYQLIAKPGNKTAAVS